MTFTREFIIVDGANRIWACFSELSFAEEHVKKLRENISNMGCTFSLYQKVKEVNNEST